MALLIGPVVALIGVLAAYLVLRTRARERQSLYAARRTLLEERAEERRQRALNPAPPAPPPPTAPMAAAPSAPAEPAVAGDLAQPATTTAPQPAWDQSPVPAPPPAPPPPPEPEPIAAAPEVPPGWEPQPNPTVPPASPPGFSSTAAVEPPPASDLAPAEPAAPISEQPPWQPQAAASEAPLAPTSEPAAEPAAEPAQQFAEPVQSPGAAWSIVESGKEAPVAAQAASSPRKPAWEIVDSGPSEQEQREKAAGDAQRRARRVAVLRGVLSYVGLVGALVVVLLGVLLMLATSH